jgi:hypothetical protein
MIKIDWNSRIGSYSFDDMVSDYGQPWKDHTEPDGTRIAVWPAVLEKNSEWEFHTHHGHAEIDRVTLEKPNVYYQAFYWMTFDSRGLLQSWEKRYSDH